jgi:hypothetical protein
MNEELSMKTITSLTLRQILCLMVLLPLLSFPAFAENSLYSLSAALGTDASMRVNFNVTTTNQLQEDTSVDVLMPNQQTATGVVKRTITDGAKKSSSKTIISLVDNAGSLELITVNNTISGMVLYDAINRAYYRADIDGNGRGVLKKEDTNTYQCADLPVASNDNGTATIPPADLIPSISELQNLESRPGASKTLYLNYWGGTISGTIWNNNFNSGNPITYTPYSSDSDTTTFSSADRYRMWLGWREAAEDFAAFDINITTKQSVYNSTAIVNRSQMIATTTNYFYTGAGGVAYLSVFNNTTDYKKTAWSWNSSAGSLGMTISHEAGHNIGLGHDGTSSAGYYSGHGVWGPIMGAPFNKEYVQWSKGDYPSANNSSQNDLTVIASVLGVVADDAGNTLGTATALSLPVTDHEGQIRPNGLAADKDVYALSLSGTTHVEVKTLLGDEGESRAANLAMNVTLKNSSGTIIARMTSGDHSPLDPTTNTFVYDGSLATGTYYLIIDAISPDTSWTTGFDEYGNEGVYRLNISTTASSNPSITAPTPGSTLSGASETFTWDANGTSVSRYWLHVGTNGVGTYNIHSASAGTATSKTITGLPIDGRPIYLRLWYFSGSWASQDYTYTAATAAVHPEVTSPTPGSTLSGASETFTWTDNGTTVTSYYLYVGTAVGSSNIYSGGQGTSTSKTLTGLPTDGSTIYFRLWYYNAGWSAQDYTYTAATTAAPEVTSPAPGSTLSSASETFTWVDNGVSVANYYLSVGTTGVGSYNIYYGYEQTATSKTITGLPTDGSTVYFRLWFLVNGSWASVDYTYTATSCGTTGITSPAPSSMLSGATVTFNWCESGATVAKYWLYVGSSTGAKDIHDSGSLGTNTSTSVSGLPVNGSTVYVRFWFYVGAMPILAEGETLQPSVQAGSWHYEDYTYSTEATAGFDEQFSSGISNWDQHNGTWSHRSSTYLYADDSVAASSRVAASYNADTYGDLDYSAKLWRYGDDAGPNTLVIRSDNTYTSTGHCRNCYIFQYTRDGRYSVWKFVNASETALQYWATSSAINQGSAWNVLRVVAEGSDLSFYINGTQVWTGTDSTHSSGRVGISAYKSSSLSLYTDWATLSIPASGSSEKIVSTQQQQLNNAANENATNYNSNQAPDTGAEALPNTKPE